MPVAADLRHQPVAPLPIHAARSLGRRRFCRRDAYARGFAATHRRSESDPRRRNPAPVSGVHPLRLAEPDCGPRRGQPLLHRRTDQDVDRVRRHRRKRSGERAVEGENRPAGRGAGPADADRYPPGAPGSAAGPGKGGDPTRSGGGARLLGQRRGLPARWQRDAGALAIVAPGSALRGTAPCPGCTP